MELRAGMVIYVFRSGTARAVELLDDARPRGRSGGRPAARGAGSPALAWEGGGEGPFPADLLPAGILPRPVHAWLTLERYRHYGVYAGRGQVIHFHGDSPARARIRCTSIATFRTGAFLDLVAGGLLGIHVDPHMAYPDGLAAVVRRARSCVGTDFGGYDLLANNCEHFATLVRHRQA
ncbi:MAG: hypothetical protein GX442_21210 [Candidatus Riflebacteria bacterium]|nr:hypothetical protein [Candidatus Riflebacteria bacterium]